MLRPLLFFLLLSQPLAIESAHLPAPIRAEDNRVLKIARRMSLDYAPLCEHRVAQLGIALHHLAEYDASRRGFLIERLNLDKGPGVVAVDPDGAAGRADIAPGDVLVAMNGTSLLSAASSPVSAEGDRRPGAAIEARMERLATNSAISFDILRGSERMTIAMSAERGCPTRFRIVASDEFNAYADGAYAMISTRLIGLAASDDELATWLAHEFAHNILGHAAQGKKRRRSICRQEIEADRLGAMIMRRSGYDVAVAPVAWRRLYDARGGRSRKNADHRGFAARMRALDDVVRRLLADLPVTGDIHGC